MVRLISVLAGAAAIATTDAFATPALGGVAQRARASSSCSLQMGPGEDLMKRAGTVLSGVALMGGMLLPYAADAAYNFPPIDSKDTTRCVFKSSAMGQSNAARDKLYDLRECPMEGKDAAGNDIAGAIMLRGDFTNAKFKGSTMSKIYADEAKFDGADLTNAVMDRGSYKRASFKGAVLANSVLSGSSFEGADLENTDFSDAYMGDFDQQRICKNPTLKGTNPKTGVDTRMSASCRIK
ncbi:hypothetical protein T484DRAFT_1975149 [Baffinella frigidus]|nr:hypothetical protein T484DRAFT_1975149 [Cryptophyta sp. CCMP2293]